MKTLYEYIIRNILNYPREGKIITQDGRYIDPSDFININKLNNYKYTRDSSSYIGYLIKPNVWIHLKKSRYPIPRDLIWSFIYELPLCYLPSTRDVVYLYNSIMSGKMKDDLITAGLYKECDYRRSEDSLYDWSYVWSDGGESDKEIINHEGKIIRSKINDSAYVIWFNYIDNCV